MKLIHRFLVRFVKLFSIVLLVSSCYRASVQIEPALQEPVHPKESMRQNSYNGALPAHFSCTPFAPLSADERASDWGKELKMGLCFAGDFDLYRAITAFKRALFLIPQESSCRRLEIEYDIVLAYFLGHKYVDVIHTVRAGSLMGVDPSFPAFNDLLLILYDSYLHEGESAQAMHILSLMEEKTQGKMLLLSALQRGDLEELEMRGIEEITHCYACNAKSVRRAELLNALLPGAGYWYVGQKQTAVTALVVNALFIGATTHFFLNGNTAAGIITLSLESGWYLGGVYGAGLAAKYYNERLFESCAVKVANREKCYPLMQLRFSF